MTEKGRRNLLILGSLCIPAGVFAFSQMNTSAHPNRTEQTDTTLHFLEGIAFFMIGTTSASFLYGDHQRQNAGKKQKRSHILSTNPANPSAIRTPSERVFRISPGNNTVEMVPNSTIVYEQKPNKEWQNNIAR